MKKIIELQNIKRNFQVGDEGRGKLRKAAGSRKQTVNRRYPNGETRRW